MITFVSISAGTLWSWLSTVWRWVNKNPFAPFLAIVLFIILIIAVKDQAGVSDERAFRMVIAIVILGVAVLVVTKVDFPARAKNAFGIFLLILLSVVMVWVSADLLIGMSFGGTQAAIAPIPFEDDLIRTDKFFASKVLAQGTIPTGASQYVVTNYGMDVWKEWINKGAGPERFNSFPPEVADAIGREHIDNARSHLVELAMKNQLIVVRSRRRFQNDHTPFAASVQFSDDTQFRLLNGCAFLVSNADPGDYRPIYRQQRFRIVKDSPTNSNVLEVEPKVGDELLMILRIESRDGMPLPRTESGFGIEIHKN